MTFDMRKVIALRSLLLDAELELGLTHLSESEKAVLCALSSISDEHGAAKAVDLLGHQLLANHSRPTIYRALSSLIEREFLSRDSSRLGMYKLIPQR